MVGAIDEMQCRQGAKALDHGLEQRYLRKAIAGALQNSIGTCTSAKCSARSLDGLPAGCSGKPRNARPRRPASGVAACTCEVMRPPNDLPPATKGRPGQQSPASATAAAHGGVRDSGWIGPLAAFSI